MTIDLTKLPRKGLRFAVLHGLILAHKAGKRVYFSGASRQKIGSALSHLRLAGWPLWDQWMGDVDPAIVMRIRCAGSIARVVPLPKTLPRAKVYALKLDAMEDVLATLGAKGVKDEIGYSRWGVLERVGLVEPVPV